LRIIAAILLQHHRRYTALNRYLAPDNRLRLPAAFATGVCTSTHGSARAKLIEVGVP